MAKSYHKGEIVLDEKRNYSNIIVLLISLLSSFLLILTSLFQWSLMDIVTPFLMPFVWLFVFCIFLTTLIVSLGLLVKRKSWKPFLIHIISILLYFFFPFTPLIINLDYAFNREERQEVLKLIESEKISPNVSYNNSIIHLPKEYQHLSKGGGDILIEENGQEVFFFTFRGILDNFSGFIYSSYDQEPQREDFGGDYKKVKRISKNWYWVSSY